MKRLWQVLAFVAATMPSFAQGQTQAPDGLELTLEGSLHFVAGQPLRFFATAFEIRRGELTPAAGAQIRVIVSYQPGTHAAEVVTGSDGRAVVELHPGEDQPDFRILFDVRHAGRQRTFDVGMTRGQAPILSIRSMTERVNLGLPMVVMGRVRDVRGVGRARVPVRLRFQHGTRLIQDVQVMTDAEGSYAAEFVSNVTTGAHHVVASFDGHATRARATFVAPTQAPLRLDVESPASARPGDTVPVQVSVRDAEGLPVEGALLVPPAPETTAQEPIRTDASGRASFTWVATTRATTVGVRVAGFEVVSQHIPIRVSERSFHVAARAEHGALIAGVPSEVYLHVVGVDGHARPNQEVTLRGARFTEQSARSDAQGVARVEVMLAPGGLDRCGGISGVAVEVVTGGEVNPLCLPVDADGALRVRAERSPSSLAVTIARRSNLERVPVSISVYRVRDGERRLEPIVQLVTRESEVEIPEAGLQVEGSPLLEVRARLMMNAREVRGDLVRVGAPFVESEGGTVRRIAVDHATAYARPQREPMSEAAFASSIAAQTPRDLAAPYVLRDGEVTSVRRPNNAAARGLLRDAHRLRARFRTGRLGLVFRAVEEYIASHGPEGVTRRQGGQTVFTASALEAMLEDGDLGMEGRHDLGGRELRLDSLRAMAPHFRFENVARRVTRERLLHVLQYVQTFVRERELDMPFARQGSPNDWWVEMQSQGLDARKDGWGRPLRFQRRDSRFGGIDPVRGWELVSAGPDGRFGNADDVWDPSARVLPAGSLYARAMNEERIVRQLQGVALGNALLLGSPGASSETSTAGGFPLPNPLVRAGLEPRAELLGEGDTPSFDGPVLEYRFDGIRRTLTRRRSERRPPQALLTSPFPTELRRGSTLALPVSFVGERSSEGQEATIEIEAEGLDVTWQGSPSGVLSATRALRGIAVLTPRAESVASVRIRLVSEGRVLTESVHEVRILPRGISRLQRAGQRVSAQAPWDVRFGVPAVAQVDVLAVAPERATLDPALRALVRRRPALSTWADTLAGRRPDSEELRALREEPPTSALDRACALVVWSAIDSDEARAALASLTANLPNADENTAAMLAAVGPLAAPSATGASDAVGRWVETLRRRLREGDSGDPRDVALQAAGLLLADPADRNGLAALQRAQTLPSVRHTAFPSLIRALARHATGEQVAFDERWMRRRPLHAQVSPEAAFWHLAASVYGVFGRSSGDVIVHRNGRTHRLPMDEGRARFSFAAEENVELRVESEGNALVRVEARYELPETARQESPLQLELNGEPGVSQSLASFELIVRAPDGAERSEVAINLPAAVQTRAAVRVLGLAEGVTGVRAVAGGLRLSLGAMEEGTERRLSLPLYWVGAGERTMSVAAWEVSKPWQVTATQPRVMEVPESW